MDAFEEGAGRKVIDETTGDFSGAAEEEGSPEQTWCSNNENLFLQFVVIASPRQWDSTSRKSKALPSNSTSSPRGMCLLKHED